MGIMPDPMSPEKKSGTVFNPVDCFVVGPTRKPLREVVGAKNSSPRVVAIDALLNSTDSETLRINAERLEQIDKEAKRQDLGKIVIAETEKILASIPLETVKRPGVVSRAILSKAQEVEGTIQDLKDEGVSSGTLTNNGADLTLGWAETEMIRMAAGVEEAVRIGGPRGDVMNTITNLGRGIRFQANPDWWEGYVRNEQAKAQKKENDVSESTPGTMPNQSDRSDEGSVNKGGSDGWKGVAIAFAIDEVQEVGKLLVRYLDKRADADAAERMARVEAVRNGVRSAEPQKTVTAEAARNPSQDVKSVVDERQTQILEKVTEVLEKLQNKVDKIEDDSKKTNEEIKKEVDSLLERVNNGDEGAKVEFLRMYQKEMGKDVSEKGGCVACGGPRMFGKKCPHCAIESRMDPAFISNMERLADMLGMSGDTRRRGQDQATTRQVPPTIPPQQGGETRQQVHVPDGEGQGRDLTPEEWEQMMQRQRPMDGDTTRFYTEQAKKARRSFERYEFSGKRIYQGIPDLEDNFYLGLTPVEASRYEARMYLYNARAKVQNAKPEFFGSTENEVQKMTTEMWQEIFNTPGVSEGVALYAGLIARPDLNLHNAFGLEKGEIFKIKKEDHFREFRSKFANYLLNRGLVGNKDELVRQILNEGSINDQRQAEAMAQAKLVDNARVAEAMAYNTIRAVRLTEEIKSIYNPAFGPVWREWLTNGESAPSFFPVSNYIGECVMNPGSMMVTSIMEKPREDRKSWPTSNFGTWFSNQFDSICPGIGRKPISKRDINNVDRFNLLQKSPVLRNGFAAMALKDQESGDKYYLLKPDSAQGGKYEGQLIDAARAIVGGRSSSYRINIDGDFDNNCPFFGWDFFGAKAGAGLFATLEAGQLPDRLGVPDIDKYFVNIKAYGSSRVEDITRKTLFVLIQSGVVRRALAPNSVELKLNGPPGTNMAARAQFDTQNRNFWTDGK
jgi:hypothetical protein